MTIKTIDTQNVTPKMLDAIRFIWNRDSKEAVRQCIEAAPAIDHSDNALQLGTLTDQEILEAWPVRGQAMPPAFDLLWFARFLERKIKGPTIDKVCELKEKLERK